MFRFGTANGQRSPLWKVLGSRSRSRNLAVLSHRCGWLSRICFDVSLSLSALSLSLTPYYKNSASLPHIFVLRARGRHFPSLGAMLPLRIADGATLIARLLLTRGLSSSSGARGDLRAPCWEAPGGGRTARAPPLAEKSQPSVGCTEGAMPAWGCISDARFRRSLAAVVAFGSKLLID